MLTSVSANTRKTQIMYHANLSYPLLCKYLTILVKNHLLRYHARDHTYTRTSTGATYLDRFAAYQTIEATIVTREREAGAIKASLQQYITERTPLRTTRDESLR
jgi:predicted transcriptional regulator